MVLHLLAVLSRHVLLVAPHAVEGATVMPPRAVIRIDSPPTNETPGLFMTLVADPVKRVLRSYTPAGIAVNAPAPLYATSAPIADSAKGVTVFFAYSVIGFAFEIAWTNLTVATVKSVGATTGSSRTQEDKNPGAGEPRGFSRY